MTFAYIYCINNENNNITLFHVRFQSKSLHECWIPVCRSLLWFYKIGSAIFALFGDACAATAWSGDVAAAILALCGDAGAATGSPRH